MADPSLADYGRLEVELNTAAMPGLLACAQQFGDTQPLQGARISGCSHLTVQAAVLIEVLMKLGAEVRWCSSNLNSTHDAAAAAAAAAGASVFAWQGQTLDEYWWCIEKCLAWPGGAGPDLLLDDGGDATLLIHEGVAAEQAFLATGALPDPGSTRNAEFGAVLHLLRDALPADPRRWQRCAAALAGVTEGSAAGTMRLYKMQAGGRLLVPAVNISDSVTKTKMDSTYAAGHSVLDGLRRATDIMISGKTVFVAGYGDVGKGVARAFKEACAEVIVSEVDPICALQARMAGFKVALLDDVVEGVDIVVTCTGNRDVVRLDHLARMKNNSIVANMGTFSGEIQVAELLRAAGVRRVNVKPQVDRFVFPDGHGVIVLVQGRLLNLGATTGHPAFVMSCILSCHTIALLDLWARRGDGKYALGRVKALSRRLDERVAALHLPALGARLTRLTAAQAAYISVPLDGPYKAAQYRY